MLHAPFVLASANRKEGTTMSLVADTPLPANSPSGFHLLAKPSGATCNIDCKYCFFLSKEALYPNDKQRMSENTLETYIRQLLESHSTAQVTVAWQGGEPTLMKLDFFRRSVEIVEKYRRPGQVVQHTFQTNGILLDDDWWAFFKEHNFLVGLSVDGPREIHDTNRVDRGGQGTFDRVMKGWRQLIRHRVDFKMTPQNGHFRLPTHFPLAGVSRSHGLKQRST